MFFTDEFFMKQALIQAREAFDKGEVPIGAVVVCNNQIIARAHNMTETLQDPTAHAEMLAITSATEFLGAKYLQNCVLYVTIEPCPMCAGATYWAQIPEIVYGAPEDKRGYTVIGKQILHPKTVVRSGILEPECRGLMQDFFFSRRTKK